MLFNLELIYTIFFINRRNKIKLRKLFVGCALVFAIILSNSRIDNNLVLRKKSFLRMQVELGKKAMMVICII